MVVLLSVNVCFCKLEQHECLLNKPKLPEELNIEQSDLFRLESHTRVCWENDLRQLGRRYQLADAEPTEQQVLLKEDIERLFCLIGYKPAFAQQLATRFFTTWNQILSNNSSSEQQERYENPQTIRMWSCHLALYLAKCVQLQGGIVTDETWEDIVVALHLIGHQFPVTILVGGTSGCGKSTLGYMLARKLGIHKVISTDTIRACLRTHSTPKDTFYGVLHSSSYEMDSYLPPQFITSETTPRKRLLKAYKLQAELIKPFIHHLIAISLWQKESVIVEGVHLSVKTMKHLVEEFYTVIPFITYISNETKHMNRFAVRVKYMALNSSGNKYIKNFQHIRQIQEYLCNKAERAGFPRIDNTNTDRSLAAAHALIFSCIKEFWRHYIQDRRQAHAALPGMIISRGAEKMIWKSSKTALLDICLHRMDKLCIVNRKNLCEENETENLVILKGKLQKIMNGQKLETKQLVEYLRQLCSESEKDEHKGD